MQYVKNLRAWLAVRGFKRPLVDYYLRSGALVPVARGAYRRPGPPLKWEHVVYSLQELGYASMWGGVLRWSFWDLPTTSLCRS